MEHDAKEAALRHTYLRMKADYHTARRAHSGSKAPEIISSSLLLQAAKLALKEHRLQKKSDLALTHSRAQPIAKTRHIPFQELKRLDDC